MSLLTNVMDHSLDDGYAEAAARKRTDGAGGMPRTVRAKLGLAAGLVLAALVVTVGAAQARVAGARRAKEREELIDRIEPRDRGGRRRCESTVDKLRDDVSARQREALKHSGGGDQADLVGCCRARRGPRPRGEAGRGRRQGSHPAAAATRARPRGSPTPAGCGTATCSGSSTGCGSRAPRPSRSTGSG